MGRKKAKQIELRSHLRGFFFIDVPKQSQPACIMRGKTDQRGIPMLNARIGAVVAGLFLLFSGFVFAAEPNTLTDDAKKSGWRLVFVGKSTDGWRGYKMEKMAPGGEGIDG